MATTEGYFSFCVQVGATSAFRPRRVQIQENLYESPRLFLLPFSGPLGFVLVFFLRFLHVSEAWNEKYTILNRVHFLPFS